MSATTTQKSTSKQAPVESKQTWLARFKTALESLDSAKSTAKQAQDVFFSRGLTIGYLLVEKYGETIEKSDREKIVDSISTVGRKANDPRTNLDDKPYSFSTVGAWHKAARIEKAIAEKNPALAGKFSADGLTKIASYEARKDLDEAVTFAAGLVDKGKTSNRAVRAAFQEVFPPSGKSEKSPSDIAVAAKVQLKGTEKGARNQLSKLKLSASAIMTVLNYAALVGMTCGDAQAATIVLRETLNEKVQ